MKKHLQIKKTALAFVFGFASFMASAQAPVIQWEKTIGGNSYDELYCLAQTSDGGYILGGTSNSAISGDKSQASKGGVDYWAVKVDANGNKQWDKTFGGSGTDDLLSLVQTLDGGYILGGQSNSGVSGDKTGSNKGGLNSYLSDYWVIKLDANGNKLWDKTYGGIDHEFFYSLAQTADGGYILGGSSRSGISGDKTQASNGAEDYWIVKLDAAGNKTWDKSIGADNSDMLSEISQTTDGGYVLGGWSASGFSGDKTQFSQGQHDYWVVKLNANGNIIWEKTFGGNNRDELSNVTQTPDGGYILSGWSLSDISGDKTQANKGSWDYWVMKLDASGNKQWDKTFGGTDHDYLSGLASTPDGGFII
jgi:hypothetical protein